MFLMILREAQLIFIQIFRWSRLFRVNLDSLLNKIICNIDLTTWTTEILLD